MLFVNADSFTKDLVQSGIVSLPSRLARDDVEPFLRNLRCGARLRVYGSSEYFFHKEDEEGDLQDATLRMNVVARGRNALGIVGVPGGVVGQLE